MTASLKEGSYIDGIAVLVLGRIFGIPDVRIVYEVPRVGLVDHFNPYDAVEPTGQPTLLWSGGKHFEALVPDAPDAETRASAGNDLSSVMEFRGQALNRPADDPVDDGALRSIRGGGDGDDSGDPFSRGATADAATSEDQDAMDVSETPEAPGAHDAPVIAGVTVDAATPEDQDAMDVAETLGASVDVGLGDGKVGEVAPAPAFGGATPSVSVSRAPSPTDSASSVPSSSGSLGAPEANEQQVGEVAPAFGGAIPSGSSSSVSSSTDSASSAPSSTDSRGRENGGGPDEDTSEDRDAVNVPEGTIRVTGILKSNGHGVGGKLMAGGAGGRGDDCGVAPMGMSDDDIAGGDFGGVGSSDRDFDDGDVDAATSSIGSRDEDGEPADGGEGGGKGKGKGKGRYVKECNTPPPDNVGANEEDFFIDGDQGKMTTAMRFSLESAPNTREFRPGASEELLALLSERAASSSSLQGLWWSGVLGVILKTGKVGGDWGLAEALVRAGADRYLQGDTPLTMDTADPNSAANTCEICPEFREELLALLLSAPVMAKGGTTSGAAPDNNVRFNTTYLGGGSGGGGGGGGGRGGGTRRGPGRGRGGRQSDRADERVESRHGTAAIQRAAVRTASLSPQELCGLALDLNEAIEGGHDDLAAALLDYGAPADGEVGCTPPLHITVKKGNAEMTQLLLQKGAEVKMRSRIESGAMTPIWWVRGSADIARLLMAAGDDPTERYQNWMSPLEQAAVDGDAEVLKVMIELGLGVNDHCKAWEAVFKGSVEKGKDIVDLLVDVGANIEARDEDSMTPLSRAASDVNIGAVRALVTHGAEINARDEECNTPLHRAVRKYDEEDRSVAEVIDFLLRSGADEALTNNDGKTPAEVAHQILVDIDSRCYADEEYANQAKEAVKGILRLLAKAPADRAWRRRRLLLLCIARNRRGQLLRADSLDHPPVDIDAQDNSRNGSADRNAVKERSNGDWTRVCNWLTGLALEQEGVFRTVVGYI
eukprot:g18857.t1